MELKLRFAKSNIKFVRKAQAYGVPVGQQVKPSSMTSKLGLERPGHKYIKRENLGNGKYRYIYDEAQGQRAPSDKDTVAMVGDFKNALEQDPNFRRYARHLDDSDYRNVGRAMIARGEEVTPDSFVQEMSNLQQTLGTKVSEYLPVAVAAKEYKRMFSMAGSRTSEYNKKLSESMQQQQMNMKEVQASGMNYLNAQGFAPEKIQQFRQDPKQLKELIGRLQSTYNNFSRGNYQSE
jgi:hypothetical protein